MAEKISLNGASIIDSYIIGMWHSNQSGKVELKSFAILLWVQIRKFGQQKLLKNLPNTENFHATSLEFGAKTRARIEQCLSRYQNLR